jgi:hypothetical protein
MAELKQLICKSCSGPVPFFAGESVITCSYCGSTFLFEGSSSNIIKVNEHYLVINKVQNEELADLLISAIEATRLAPPDIEDNFEILETKGRYLPYWTLNCKATTVYTGSRIRHKREKISSDGEKDSYRTTEEYVPCDGQFKKEHWWPIYGRHIDEFEGLDALKPGNLSVNPCWQNYPFSFFGSSRSGPRDHASMKIPFEVHLLDPRITVVNGQIDRDDATREARQEIELYSWQKAKAEVSILQQCETKIRVIEAAFVHIPFWWIKYKYKDRIFCSMIHGHSKEILYLAYPVGNRIKLYISLALTIMATFISVPALSGQLRYGVVIILWIVFLIHALFLLFNDSDNKPETDSHTNDRDN